MIEEPGKGSLDISHLISFARRQMVPFLICCVAAIALGVLYTVMAEPLYTASATLFIDNRQVRAVQELSTLSDQPMLDTAAVESQVEVLRSERVALAVIKQLKLDENPAFVNPPKSWIDEILLKVGVSTIDDPKSQNYALLRQRMILKILGRNLEVSRIGRTFVVQVDYTSPDPGLSAEIANAYANAYLFEQVNSRIEAARRARNWLRQRAEELRELAVNADLAAQKFKADNNLLATKGMLISDQQFNEMTTQLVTARSETAQTQARYLRIKNIIDTRQTESAVTESLDNPVISELRTKYLDAAKRKADFERKLGPDHTAVINLQSTMDEFGKLLFQELGRIAQSYLSDYEVAAAREKALANYLAQQQAVAVAANDAQAQLRQLEQKAESYQTIYHTYLQRDQEAAQQESFPLTDAHIITVASRPVEPSRPRKVLIIGFSVLLGAVAGVGIAMLREAMDRVFRTGEQVRDELGCDVLGMLPALSPEPVKPMPPETAVDDPKRNMLDKVAPILRYSIDHPFSAYAETLRSSKVAADIALNHRPRKIIGLVSLLPGEGKSTIAKNLASLLAVQGAKTLLIDGDIRNPALTRLLGAETEGRVESEPCLASRMPGLLEHEFDSGLDVLPCIFAKNDRRAAAGLSSAALEALLQNLGRSYEYVVIDLPPIGPVINARSMAPAIDGFIFVVAWGQTSRGAVRAVLAREHSIKAKLLGVILNKVDMNKLAVYEHFGSEGYYHKEYSSYFKQTI